MEGLHHTSVVRSDPQHRRHDTVYVSPTLTFKTNHIVKNYPVLAKLVIANNSLRCSLIIVKIILSRTMFALLLTSTRSHREVSDLRIMYHEKKCIIANIHVFMIDDFSF